MLWEATYFYVVLLQPYVTVLQGIGGVVEELDALFVQRNVQKFWLKEINCYYFWDPSAGTFLNNFGMQ